VERAALGLLRVVGRLLAYKEGADSLVNSLQLLPKMRTQLAWDLSPKTTAQVRSQRRLISVCTREARWLNTRCVSCKTRTNRTPYSM